MSQLSEKILQLLSEKNISYGELSRMTNIPKSALQRYAVGETEKIPIDRLEAISYALDSTPSDLMGWGHHEIVNMYGDHEANLSYLKDKDELLQLYNDIYHNQNLALLFDSAKDLQPTDLEMVLTIIRGIRKERGIE